MKEQKRLLRNISDNTAREHGLDRRARKITSGQRVGLPDHELKLLRENEVVWGSPIVFNAVS